MLDTAAKAELDAMIGKARGPVIGADGGGSLASRIKASGWRPDLPGRVRFDYKAVIDTPADANPSRQGGIVAPPVDGRYAFAALRQQPLPTGPEGQPVTQVTEPVADDPSFATPSDMILDIAGSTQKSESTVGASLQTFDVKMIATISELVANAIFGLPAFTSWSTRHSETRTGLRSTHTRSTS
jgi:hypothetical protein